MDGGVSLFSDFVNISSGIFRFKMYRESMVLTDFVDSGWLTASPCQLRHDGGPLRVPDCATGGVVTRGLGVVLEKLVQ